MDKILVAYFSAQGTTKRIAEKIFEFMNCDLYEIKPKEPYTADDLNWMDSRSRSSVEMKDYDSRPELEDTDAKIEDYDLICIGYPIWWYREPSIIDTFMDAYDFSGKKLVLFATSGGSGLGESVQRIEQLSKGGRVINSRRLPATINEVGLKKWLEEISN